MSEPALPGTPARGDSSEPAEREAHRSQSANQRTLSRADALR